MAMILMFLFGFIIGTSVSLFIALWFWSELVKDGVVAIKDKSGKWMGKNLWQ